MYQNFGQAEKNTISICALVIDLALSSLKVKAYVRRAQNLRALWSAQLRSLSITHHASGQSALNQRPLHPGHPIKEVTSAGLRSSVRPSLRWSGFEAFRTMRSTRSSSGTWSPCCWTRPCSAPTAGANPSSGGNCPRNCTRSSTYSPATCRRRTTTSWPPSGPPLRSASNLDTPCSSTNSTQGNKQGSIMVGKMQHVKLNNIKNIGPFAI